jgi:AraC family ethanolamine operon transcriptional activator
VAGLSERALRNAFYDVHGVGPKRWMLGARLRDVRRALTSAPASTTTVTVVATDHGFSELGRFAVAYRETFGESPSATLRGTRRRPLTWLDTLDKRI